MKTREYATELDGCDGFIHIWQPADTAKGEPSQGVYLFLLYVAAPRHRGYELKGTNGHQMKMYAKTEAEAVAAIQHQIKVTGVEPIDSAPPARC